MGRSLGFNLSKVRIEVNKVVNLIRYHCLNHHDDRRKILG